MTTESYSILDENNIAQAGVKYTYGLDSPPANYVLLPEGADPEDYSGREYFPGTEAWGPQPPPPTHRQQVTAKELVDLMVFHSRPSIMREIDDGAVNDDELYNLNKWMGRSDNFDLSTEDAEINMYYLTRPNVPNGGVVYLTEAQAIEILKGVPI